MKTYLILSPAYYGNVDNLAMYRISAKLQNIHKNLKAKNMKLDFAAFRYDNYDRLNVYEYCMLLEFIGFCFHAKVTPLLNLSHYKLEILLLLWLHGFKVGVHFKESDIPLLKKNICKDLQSIFNINPQENPTTLYNKIKHTSQFIAKITKRLFIDKTYLESFIAPLKNAINICSTTSKYLKNSTQYNNDAKRFYAFVSTHSINDLEEMMIYNINYATISPIFYDKGNKALGLDYLQTMPSNLKDVSFALGGIHGDLQVKQIDSLGLCGFASISYFLNL